MSQPDAKKPSLLLPLVAAIVAAAVVSFAVVSATKSEAAPAPTEDPRIAVLERSVKGLGAEVSALKALLHKQASAYDTAQTATQAHRTSAEQTVTALGKTTAALEGQQAKLSTTFLALQGETQSLNGRIEANRHTIRTLDKRLKAAEGK